MSSRPSPCLLDSLKTLDIWSQAPSVAEAAGPSRATRTGPMRLACQGIRPRTLHAGHRLRSQKGPIPLLT
ncbi:Uncharacterized protein HZ326_23468 [Fusarium oxysporum f. sp. albedinis]|nr:Uncharacterized protein HZ326_23468 [Fusarium oxysporum f. sp. albedinis]